MVEDYPDDEPFCGKCNGNFDRCNCDVNEAVAEAELEVRKDCASRGCMYCSEILKNSKN